LSIEEIIVSENMMPWLEALSFSLIYTYLFLGVGYFIVKRLRGIVRG